MGQHGGASTRINSRTRRPNVVEGEVETPGCILLNTGRYAYPTGISQCLQPSGNVDSATKNVAVLHHDVALVNADTELNAFLGSHPGITFGHAVLNLSRTPQGIDDTLELDQQSVARCFDDPAPMLGDLRID
jgi:hypothetical protein